MEAIHGGIKFINGYLWGPPMLILLIGTHMFLTIRLRFIQSYTFFGIKLSVKKDDEGKGDVSQFGALTAALAATIGTGNIIGVATAISMGGPGAVFWMWITGVLGIATKYAEGVLAVKYRVKTSDGTMLGGPMYALEKGMKMKWLAVLFSIFTAVAAFGIGNMVQANSIAGMVKDTFQIDPAITGIVLTVLTALVILGGVKAIARVTSLLVPLMAFFYVLGCIIILFINGSFIIPALGLIARSAFTPEAAGGGFVGATLMMTLRYGIARGLFSNESGLGSAPILAASAQTRNPVRQALVSATGTFWDTVVVCAMTGLVLVTTIMKFPDTLMNYKDAQLTKMAFSQIPVVGPIVLTGGLLTFVYSTILGWSYYGERAVEYLFGKVSIIPYRVVWVVAVFVGSVLSLNLVFDFADAMNAMMAIPNIVTLIFLSGVVAAETKKYLWLKNIDAVSEENME
ncbi:MAG: alanine:cation symporter family protein [Brevinematales bacterium]|nr:alanine:cation symporter family protein [Brevinematales bacterium]